MKGRESYSKTIYETWNGYLSPNLNKDIYELEERVAKNHLSILRYVCCSFLGVHAGHYQGQARYTTCTNR